MAAHQDYFPTQDGELTGWTNAFDTALAPNAVTIGLTSTEQTALTHATADIRTAITESNAAQAAAKQAVAAKNARIKAAEAVIRPIVKRAKTSSGYTEAIGQALGVIGSDDSTDWTTYKPIISAEAHPGYLDIIFKKLGVDGVNVYTRLKGTAAWTKLAYDSHSPYRDNRPSATPGNPENREYMAIGVMNDAEVGQMSDIISVAFAG